MAFETGPYLSAALLCEKVLVEQDSVKSLIRIFDRTIHASSGADAPQAMQPFQHRMYLFLGVQ
jgi:hypothetical protein